MTEPLPQQGSKLARLLKLLASNPAEFRDRLLTLAEFQLDRIQPRAAIVPVSTEDFIQQIDKLLNGRFAPFLNDGPLREIEIRVADGLKRLPTVSSIEMFHNPGSMLPRICYAFCRALRPKVVLETGVAHGVTSAFILQALAANNNGELWSIDLPPLGDAAQTNAGSLIPAGLRSRWHLLRGVSRRALPPLVSVLPAIDLFLHDSLHTYRNMMSEFQTVWPKLSPGGLLLSDDVEMNRAFEHFANFSRSNFVLAASETDKASAFGIIIKPEV
jgi:predicted O-methyltransferase YrrM